MPTASGRGSVARDVGVSRQRPLPRPADERLVTAVAPRLRYVPLAIAGVYVVVLVSQLNSILAAITQNADAVVPGQLAALMSAHSGVVVLGNSPWYSTLLFDLSTRWLPFYRLLWELAPLLASGICIAAVAWSVSRVAGRWAGALTLSLLICASAPLLTEMSTLNDHTLTWLSDGLLIAGLVWILDPRRQVPRSRWLPAAVALGLVVSLNLASDPLLYFGGIIPVIVAATVARIRSPSARTNDALGYALLTSAIAVAGSIEVARLMNSHLIIPDGYAVGLAPLSAISGNLGLWLHSIALLGGDGYSGPNALLSAVFHVAALVAVAAVLLIVDVLLVELRPTAAVDESVDGDAQYARARRTMRGAFALAWGSSALCVSAAFVLSTAPGGLTTSRYLVGVVIAAAALAPLLARNRRSVAAVVVAASVYGACGVISIADGQASRGPGITQAQANTLLRLARAEHVHVGYAGYWDAAPVTWKTNFRLLVYPATTCYSAGICRFENGSESAWYSPHRGERTFLITDKDQSYMPSAPRSLGPPAATFHVGGEYTFNVYNYDIAARFVR
jgi:hypothetical protein